MREKEIELAKSWFVLAQIFISLSAVFGVISGFFWAAHSSLFLSQYDSTTNFCSEIVKMNNGSMNYCINQVNGLKQTELDKYWPEYFVLFLSLTGISFSFSLLSWIRGRKEMRILKK